MPSGLRKTSGNHFEIYYEAPWGGVASNAAPSDIAENQLVTMFGVSIRNGLLCYSTISSQNSKYDLELITPTGIPPFGADGGGGGGGYNTVGIVSITGTYNAPGVSTVQLLTIQLAAPATDISEASVVVAGNSNPILNIPMLITTDDPTFFVMFSFLSNGTTSGSPINGTGGTFTYFSSSLPPTPPVPQDWPGAYICLIFNCANYLCAVDQYGFSYVATLQTDGTIKFQLDQTAVDGPIIGHGTPTAVKVVGGVAYISVYSTGILYAYTPTVSYVVATTYAAGQIIDIFDEYMIQLNTNSVGGDGIQPTRINWSGPDEFTTWDPSVNRVAGFQSLTSVEDYISGFVAVDNVGYIFKREGVTQITATGVAIGPFNFTTYWNSVAGQGLIFPATLKQYGRLVFLATDSDIYLFYGGSFTSIAEPARAAIYASFNQDPPLNAIPNSLVTAGFSIYPFNDKTPIGEYVFASYVGGVTPSFEFWFYNVNGKTWTSISVLASVLLADYVEGTSSIVINSIQSATVFLNYIANATFQVVSNLPVNIFYINFSYVVSGVIAQKTFIYYNLVNTPTADTTSITVNPGPLILNFRQEEIKLGYTRKTTIRRIVIKAYGSGTLVVSVSGIGDDGTIKTVSLGNVILDGTNTIRTYYTKIGIATIEAPQLSITSSNFNGAIQKVMMAGTYADGEID